jgi:hypothetical protein
MAETQLPVADEARRTSATDMARDMLVSRPRVPQPHTLMKEGPDVAPEAEYEATRMRINATGQQNDVSMQAKQLVNLDQATSQAKGAKGQSDWTDRAGVMGDVLGEISLKHATFGHESIPPRS